MNTRQSKRHICVADVATLYRVKTEMPVLGRVLLYFWRMPVAFAADDITPSLCVAMHALHCDISNMCVRLSLNSVRALRPKSDFHGNLNAPCHSGIHELGDMGI